AGSKNMLMIWNQHWCSSVKVSHTNLTARERAALVFLTCREQPQFSKDFSLYCVMACRAKALARENFNAQQNKERIELESDGEEETLIFEHKSQLRRPRYLLIGGLLLLLIIVVAGVLALAIFGVTAARADDDDD